MALEDVLAGKLGLKLYLHRIKNSADVRFEKVFVLRLCVS